MTPRHDEIVKVTSDGFTVAWDMTLRADDARAKAVEKVVKEQATELGAIIGTATGADRAEGKARSRR